MMPNSQNLNIQQTPGLTEFPPSLHANIGACDPATTEILPPGTVPGHPTGVQMSCQGTAVAGEYPSMLLAPAKVIPLPAEPFTRLNVDADFVLSSSFVNGGQCFELDDMLALNDVVYPAGLHFLLREGCAVQVSDSTGLHWIDAGFSCELTPDVLHHITLHLQYGWEAETLTWLGVTIDRKPFKVTGAAQIVKASNWGWEGVKGTKFQWQMDSTPVMQLPIVSVVDHVNETFMP